MLWASALTTGLGFAFTSSLSFKKLARFNKEKDNTRPPISGVALKAILLFSSCKTVTGCSLEAADVFIVKKPASATTKERICLPISVPILISLRITVQYLHTLLNMLCGFITETGEISAVDLTQQAFVK